VGVEHLLAARPVGYVDWRGSTGRVSCLMTMDRRQFLRVTAAGAVTSLSVPVVGAGARRADDRTLRALAYPELLGVLGAERVRAIGVSYREATPAERNTDALRAAIDPAALVARDFADERTVLVDGWVLSITEARQCALFSLLGR